MKPQMIWALFGLLATALGAGYVIQRDQVAQLRVALAEFEESAAASAAHTAAANEDVKSQVDRLGVELAELQKTSNASAARTATIHNTVKAVESAVMKLGRPPDIDELAKVILTSSSRELIGALAKVLVTTPAYSAVLRGTPGRSPHPREISRELMATTSFDILVDEVAIQLWSSRRRDILGNDELIASVAATVFERYGKEISGGSSQTPLALAIAQELAGEPGFAELVASLGKR